MTTLARLGLLLALATPASGQDALTADTFDTLTQGRTMTWAQYGQVYGVEQYLPGRRVRWTVLGDDCLAGHWYPQGPDICFQYEDRPDPICWTMTLGAGGLTATLSGDGPLSPPVTLAETTDPLACFGPEVGV